MLCASLHVQSPFQMLYNIVPEIKHPRVFGCACFPLLKPYNTSKFQPKIATFLFLGYASQYKGFICLDNATGKIHVSRHVLFDKASFRFSTFKLSPPSQLSSASSQLHSSQSLVHSPQLTPIITLTNEALSPSSHSLLSQTTNSLNMHSSSA